MELEELKTMWTSANRRMDDLESANRAITQKLAQTQTREAARSLRREPIFELIVAALVALWSGGFLADNLSKIPQLPLGALPGFVIFALAIFTIVLSVRQLVIISELDYSGPVLEAQRRIAALRSIRVRSTQLVILLGIPLWLIFPIFLGQALVGYELVLKMNAAWILGNALVGAVIALAIYLAAKTWGKLPFFQSLTDILAGTEISKAQKLLAEVEAFSAS